MANKYWSEIVGKLDPYVPGEQPKISGLTKLNTNENPYGPSPKALQAMADAVSDDLRLYPDPNAEALKQAVANYYSLDASQVFVGNGSDEVLAHLFNGLLKHDQPILFPDITYSFYPVYCGLYEIDYRPVPLAENFSINVTDYQQPNGGIIFPNPNAPTGRLLPLAEIEKLLQANTESVVVVDEAYIDFADKGADESGGASAVTLINRYPNLLVTQTLSKSRSLAGMRIGLAMGNAELIEALERVKNSFNSYPLSRVAIAGAVAAIEDEEYFQQTCQAVISEREKVTQSLQQLGFEIIPSAANFVFARHPQRDAAELSAELRQRNIIVRHFKQPRIDQYLRITVGTPEQNQVLMEALKEVV